MGGGERAAGGEHVVDDEDAVPCLEGVLVDLQGVGPVLEVVGHRDGLARQLARLADQADAGSDSLGFTVPVELGGPEGPEPTRYGDWERKGRCIDF